MQGELGGLLGGHWNHGVSTHHGYVAADGQRFGLDPNTATHGAPTELSVLECPGLESTFDRSAAPTGGRR